MTPDWNSMQVLRYTDKGDEIAAMKKGPDGFIIAEFVDGSIETLDAANLMMDVVNERKKKDAESKKKTAAAAVVPAAVAPEAEPAAAADEGAPVPEAVAPVAAEADPADMWPKGKQARMCIGACICK